MTALLVDRRINGGVGIRCLGVALLLCGVAELCAAASAQWTSVPKEALAFYYGWYGNPDVSGSWIHWRNVDPAKKHIDESTHFPALGAYDTHDPKIVDTHCRQAKEAGLTGFIATWWRQRDFHDQGMRLLLDTAAKHELKITVYYESAPNVESAVDDLLYIMKSYAGHSAWLKVSNKPVIFVYGRAIDQLKLEGWAKVIADFNSKFPAGAVFVGDQISPAAAKVFDGLHTYNPTGLTPGKSPDETRSWAKTTFPQWVKTAGPDRIACVTIIPGYDDSCQPSRKPPRPITERYQGDTYKVMWEEVIAANPDWVLVCSWNEWHEGSEIEPSAELGDKDLKTTAEFAPKFIKLKPRAP
jgi:glycoprotein endo-alpha-1,2-mannosidase